MRTGSERVQNQQAAGAEADLSRRVEALFGRCPTLAGFSVQEASGMGRDRQAEALQRELCIADVAVQAWPELGASRGLYDEIAQMLLELLEERPESYDLLRGRTFARTFH
ncbi:MAG TPA: hypothetical protein VFB08_13190 [Burkholderiales bacterium]|nr:hypothetical protein [Burkholderiales bacterium]